MADTYTEVGDKVDQWVRDNWGNNLGGPMPELESTEEQLYFLFNYVGGAIFGGDLLALVINYVTDDQIREYLGEILDDYFHPEDLDD